MQPCLYAPIPSDEFLKSGVHQSELSHRGLICLLSGSLTVLTLLASVKDANSEFVLIDGLVIAGAFLLGIPLGIVTSLAIALHEIPQEIGDFGVLVYGGFDRR